MERKELLCKLQLSLFSLDYCVSNQTKILSILIAVALQRQASAAKGMERGGRGGSGAAGFLGRKIQLLASFLCRDLPLLHVLHQKINEFRSCRPPSQLGVGVGCHCRAGDGMGLCEGVPRTSCSRSSDGKVPLGKQVLQNEGGLTLCIP